MVLGPSSSVLGPLHAIVDVDVAARAGWAPLDLAHAYLDGGARLLQIRAKQLPSGLFLDACDGLVDMALLRAVLGEAKR